MNIHITLANSRENWAQKNKSLPGQSSSLSCHAIPREARASAGVVSAIVKRTARAQPICYATLTAASSSERQCAVPVTLFGACWINCHAYNTLSMRRARAIRAKI